MYEKSASERESGGTVRYAVLHTQPDHGRNGTDSPIDFLTINYIVPVFFCTHRERKRERERKRDRKIATNGLIRVEHSGRTTQIAFL